jgi:hypothetical protein
LIRNPLSSRRERESGREDKRRLKGKPILKQGLTLERFLMVFRVFLLQKHKINYYWLSGYDYYYIVTNFPGSRKDLLHPHQASFAGVFE